MLAHRADQSAKPLDFFCCGRIAIIIFMARTIVIANQKGGVGKTTTAVNMAASLAVAEKRVLLVDTDSQGNTTSGLGIDKNSSELSLYDFYFGEIPLQDIIVDTALPYLKLVPSSLDLVGAEIELISVPNKETILRNGILAIHDRFDYVIIDCPPALGLLTLNALVAAQTVMVPVQCEYYALEGLGQLMRTVELVRDSFNSSLEIEGILLTMVDMRNSLAKQVAAEVKKHFGDKVYDTMIPRNVTLSEAPSHGKPVMLYDIRSKGAQSYLALAREVLLQDG